MQNYNFTRHCATSRKVAGLIPDGVIKFFCWQSCRLLCGPEVNSASNRNEYREYLLGGRGKGDRCVRLTMLPPSCADCLQILGASNSCRPNGKSRPFIMLPAVLLLCETRLISRNGHGLKKFDKRMLRAISGRKKEVGGGQTKPHNHMSFISWMVCQISRRSHAQGWNERSI
jgi:hypothetical protein